MRRHPQRNTPTTAPVFALGLTLTLTLTLTLGLTAPALAQLTLQSTLTAPSPAAYQHFGVCAITPSHTIIGSPTRASASNIERQGAAFIFSRSSSSWPLQVSLSPSDGAIYDAFGHHVALTDDYAIVGAPHHDLSISSVSQLDAGAAYIFSRTSTSWGQMQKLTAADAKASDGFGSSVVIISTVAVVGAPNRDRLDSIVDSAAQGAAYIFTRTASTWSQVSVVTGSDSTGGDFVGSSVAIDTSGAVIVGAWSHDAGSVRNKGAVYVFTASGSSYAQQAKLTGTGANSGARFGWSVSASSGVLAVGAPMDVGGNSKVEGGAVYVFTRSSSSGVWTQTARLTESGSNAAAGNEFGGSVSVSSGAILAGSRYADIGSNSNQGRGTLFVGSGSSWASVELPNQSGGLSDEFGVVGLSNGYGVIGAPRKLMSGGLVAGGSVSVYTVDIQKRCYNQSNKHAPSSDLELSFSDDFTLPLVFQQLFTASATVTKSPALDLRTRTAAQENSSTDDESDEKLIGLPYTGGLAVIIVVPVVFISVLLIIRFKRKFISYTTVTRAS